MATEAWTSGRQLSRLLVLLVGLGPFAQRAAAQEQPINYIWGIRGPSCKFEEKLGRAIENRLIRMGETVQLLWPNPASEIGSCTDAECGRRLRQACPYATGILIGGDVEETTVRRDASEPAGGTPSEEVWSRLRLWRVDLATYAVHSRSAACRQCKLTELVARQTAELFEQAAPASQELACPRFEPAQLDATADAREPEGLVLSVSADGSERRGEQRAVLDLLKRTLRRTGREVTVEGNRRDLRLSQPRTRHRGEQRLDVSLMSEGGALLSYLPPAVAPALAPALASAPDITEAIIENARCFGCTDDELAHRIALTAGSLLDRCHGDSCLGAAPRVVLQRPSMVCAPLLPPARCSAPPPRSASPAVEPPPAFLVPPCLGSAEPGAPRKKALFP